MEERLLTTKSPSVESFSSAISFMEDAPMLEKKLFESIDNGDLETVVALVANSNFKTPLLQLLLTVTHSNHNLKYTFDSEIAAVADELLGQGYV